MPRESLPRLKDVILQGGHIFLPIFVLIYLLIIDYTPFYASSACVVVIFLIGLVRANTRLTPGKLLIALEASARVAITVSGLSAAAAIIYGVITLTGLLVKVTSVILALSGGSLLLGIVFIAVMSYVLGMGLPVTASYVLIAALGAPALAELGAPMLAAHLIIFWFSQDSTITPPVCMTAFVAARIADASPMRTGWQAVLMAKALYIMPFVFAYGSLLSDSLAEIFFDFAVLFGSLALLPAAVEGFMIRPLSPVERGIFAVASLSFLAAAFGPIAEGWPWAAGAAVIWSAGMFFVRQHRAAANAKNHSP
jgi:TRAP-type uncharacterized transport system fused permease subunit